MSTNDIMTIRQVAERLQVHVNTVYNYISRGDLKAVKLSRNGRWRIFKEDLDVFIGLRIAEAQGPEEG